jgi:hypothetical protein
MEKEKINNHNNLKISTSHCSASSGKSAFLEEDFDEERHIQSIEELQSELEKLKEMLKEKNSSNLK